MSKFAAFLPAATVLASGAGGCYLIYNHERNTIAETVRSTQEKYENAERMIRILRNEKKELVDVILELEKKHKESKEELEALRMNADISADERGVVGLTLGIMTGGILGYFAGVNPRLV